MHNPDEHVALAPEIVRNADATDNGAAETERVHRQRLASWDVAAVRVERIAHRITGVAVRAVGTVALAMMVFDWGNGGALMEWIRQTITSGAGVALPIGGTAYLLMREWIRARSRPE